MSEEPKKEGSSLAEMIKEGRAYLNFRYRFEHVDQDGVLNKAKASTLRSRLGFDTAEFAGFSAKLEIEDISEIGSDSYNNTINAKSDYAVVADPDGTEVNQAYLTFSGISDTKIRGGREAINLDNLRFIGDVGWRQNNQTYDGVNLTNTTIEDIKFFYSFVGNVNRIFGDDSDNGDLDTSLNLFNIAYTGIPGAKLVTYVYLLDVEDVPGLSTSNVGISLVGKVSGSDSIDILYDFEFAHQEDYEDNPLEFDAKYWRASLGAKVEGISLVAGFESLGSDQGNIGFSTPFATLHKWNGWADKFLSTPDSGLEDTFVKASYVQKDISENIDKLVFAAVYHYFSADEGSDKYGTEWDFNFVVNFLKNYSAGVKYAVYNADNFATDTEKLIFTLTSNFNQ